MLRVRARVRVGVRVGVQVERLVLLEHPSTRHTRYCVGLVLLEDLNYILYMRLVLLEHLARDVERQRVAVDDALNEAEVLGQQLVELVGDHHAAHVELQVVLLLVVVLVEGEGQGWG